MERALNGTWAVVTGASSGMGADFARKLALMGFKLVLTARRETELMALATELRAKTQGLELRVVPGDLSDLGFREKLLEETAGLPVSTLINNAGFGAYGPFDELDPVKERAMIELDIVALVHLTREFAGRMKSSGEGFILETASIAAFQPCPLYSSYGAAKAFVLSYGLAVREELAGTGVSLTVLSPGVTKTQFFDAAGNTSLSTFQRMTMMDSDAVVSGALAALFHRRSVFVPGFLNGVNALLTRFVSRSAAARMALSMMR